LFNEFVTATHSSANSHVPKRASSDKSSCSPRVQSRLESVTHTLSPVTLSLSLFSPNQSILKPRNLLQVNSCPPNNEFVPDDVLTRNTASHLCQLPEKQQKIYNALALASVSSASGLMDTSRNTFLTSAALKQFIGTQQMEYVDEHVCAHFEAIRIHI
jgi:hypothetical protein